MTDARELDLDPVPRAPKGQVILRSPACKDSRPDTGTCAAPWLRGPVRTQSLTQRFARPLPRGHLRPSCPRSSTERLIEPNPTTGLRFRRQDRYS